MTDADKAVELVRRALELLANDDRGEADAWCDAAIGFLEWGRCEYKDRDGEGCEAPAKFLAYSREREATMRVCGAHENTVIEERAPEYWHMCENCGCTLPIN